MVLEQLFVMGSSIQAAHLWCWMQINKNKKTVFSWNLPLAPVCLVECAIWQCSYSNFTAGCCPFWQTQSLCPSCMAPPSHRRWQSAVCLVLWALKQGQKHTCDGGKQEAWVPLFREPSCCICLQTCYQTKPWVPLQHPRAWDIFCETISAGLFQTIFYRDLKLGF